MLDAGHDIAGQGRGSALIGVNHHFGDTRDQVGVFTKAFGGAAPARVAGNVDHRRERQVDAVGAGFLGRYPTAQRDGVHVPA